MSGQGINMKHIIGLAIVLLISACTPTPDSIQRGRPEPIQFNGNDRFKVERVSVFSDGLAYGEKRGIYVITDRETNQEFVGISGIGISELASHQVGKARNTDER